MKSTTTVDDSPTTIGSLMTLEKVLKELAIERRRGEQVRIYELRDYEFNPNSAGVGFYLCSPNQAAIIRHNFRVPQKKDFSDIPVYEGGTGVLGYKQAIATIYRYLNFQPRFITPVSYRLLRENLYDSSFWRETLPSAIEREVKEDRSITKRLLKDLDLPFPHTDFSFIVLDVESSVERETFRKYLCGCTWDFYNGIRIWDEGGINGENLVKECTNFDRVVSFNGRDFDIGKILMPFASYPDIFFLQNKSIDLFKIITSAHQGKGKKGELKLASLAFATLGDCKYEVDLDTRRVELADYGSQIMNHCVRDVEMTRDLFFYMLQNQRVFHITQDALERGRIVESIELFSELVDGISRSN